MYQLEKNHKKEKKFKNVTIRIGCEELPWLSSSEKVKLSLIEQNGSSLYIGSCIRGSIAKAIDRDPNPQSIFRRKTDKMFLRMISILTSNMHKGISILDSPASRFTTCYVGNGSERVYAVLIPRSYAQSKWGLKHNILIRVALVHKNSQDKILKNISVIS